MQLDFNSNYYLFRIFLPLPPSFICRTRKVRKEKARERKINVNKVIITATSE